MKDCAIIACDNGLGHVRRCYLIGLELARQGIKVDLFAPREKYMKFSALFNPEPLLNNIAFATHTSPDGFIKGEPVTTRWHQRLPDMSGYDIVLSDNHPEILNVRTDAFISGHFFWHDAIEDVDASYREAASRLFMRLNPPVIGSKLFASRAIISLPRYKPVGLYSSDQPCIDGIDGRNLLISGGSTPVLRAALCELVKWIVDHGPEPFETIFVDPDILPSGKFNKKGALPGWIRMAEYSTGMYRSVTAAVCRPGIGTVTDLLQNGGRPFCVYENKNKELLNNAAALAAAGLGADCKTPDIALKRAGQYTVEQSARRMHAKLLREIDFDGAAKTARIVCGR